MTNMTLTHIENDADTWRIFRAHKGISAAVYVAVCTKRDACVYDHMRHKTLGDSLRDCR
jgi:hypothetical protein